ncbi:MAG: cupin domain-containing protein [Thermomicrobiales bacterium]
MRLERADLAAEKGWYLGPWNSDLQVAVGWATTGIDLPHYHRRMTEIYLVARGTATARVEDETLELHAGDVLVCAPGDAHTFLHNSDDYLHFVIHTPALPHGAAQADHVGVARDRLGL